MLLFTIKEKGLVPEALEEVMKSISDISLETTKDRKLKENIDYVFFEGVEKTPDTLLSKYVASILLSSEPSVTLLLAIVEILECFLSSPEIDKLMADVFEVLNSCNWLGIGNAKIMNFLGYTPRGEEDMIVESVECSEGLKGLTEGVKKLSIKGEEEKMNIEFVFE